jgi:2-isopropylmalate synthase
VSAAELKKMFWEEYIERSLPLSLQHFHADGAGGIHRCRASVVFNKEQIAITGEGNGPIAAFVNGLKFAGIAVIEVTDYRQAALGSGTEASAISYVRIRTLDGASVWGAGVNTNIELSSIQSVVSAINRSFAVVGRPKQ